MSVAVNLNGTIVGPLAAQVSVFDHGFLYGDSVYETVRTHGGRVFLLAEHLERLARSAAAIGLALPLATKALADEVRRTVEAAANAESAVRIIVTRGAGAIGLDPRLCPQPTLVVIARPYEALPAEAYERGVQLVVARTARNSARALDPGIKSGNFLNNILAAREALAAGAFEAVMLNPEANVAEGTQSNVFVVTGGAVATPDPRAGLLRGITRDTVLALCRAAAIPVAERDVFVTELYEADEVFLTSSLKGIVPARSLGGRPIGAAAPGPLTRRLMELYRARVERFVATGE